MSAKEFTGLSGAERSGITYAGAATAATSGALVSKISGNARRTQCVPSLILVASNVSEAPVNQRERLVRVPIRAGGRMPRRMSSGATLGESASGIGM